jgi:ABC-type phosphate transport system substrate-binding protein
MKSLSLALRYTQYRVRFALWVGAVFLVAAPALSADVAIVVSPDVPADNLTLEDTRKIFLGDRQFWNSKLRITLLVRAPVARERDVVLKTIYQMSEAQYRQYWISKVFRAEVASGPKIVYSNQMATELVANIPGSVSFIDASEIPKGIKVVKINGLLPGQKGYPLR